MIRPRDYDRHPVLRFVRADLPKLWPNGEVKLLKQLGKHKNNRTIFKLGVDLSVTIFNQWDRENDCDIPNSLTVNWHLRKRRNLNNKPDKAHYFSNLIEEKDRPACPLMMSPFNPTTPYGTAGMALVDEMIEIGSDVSMKLLKGWYGYYVEVNPTAIIPYTKLTPELLDEWQHANWSGRTTYYADFGPDHPTPASMLTWCAVFTCHESEFDR